MDDSLPWPMLDPIPPGWLDDTPADAVRRLRAQAPQRRAATAHVLWRSARAAVAAGERLRHPRDTDRQIAARVRARIARADT